MTIEARLRGRGRWSPWRIAGWTLAALLLALPALLPNIVDLTDIRMLDARLGTRLTKQATRARVIGDVQKF